MKGFLGNQKWFFYDMTLNPSPFWNIIFKNAAARTSNRIWKAEM